MEEKLEVLVKVVLTIGLVGFISLCVRLYNVLVFKPGRLGSKLGKQGISGPSPSFLIGNVREVLKKKTQSTVKHDNQILTHDCFSIICPYFKRWQQEYGPVFMFSLGNIEVLYMNNSEVVKEISTCTSPDFGKPSYQLKLLGPLLGQGILTSNGAIWAQQRKILAPALHMDKINVQFQYENGMMKLMVDSSITLLNSWENRIENEGGVADIKIDKDMRNLSADVISRACFGSNYSQGEKIFSKLRTLEEEMSKKFMSSSTIPGMSYIPTKSNRKIWRLEKEICVMILKVVKEREKDNNIEDLLQMILQGAKNSELDQVEMERFIVDNCKNVYLAGSETNAISSMWTLMLLASNLEWQTRIRAEISKVCGTRLLDADLLQKMKTLTKVIHESLRLYSLAIMISREALQDMKLGGINVPKGINMWTMVAKLHQDPELWGPDAAKFNLERFTNGVSGACKLPQAYMPFGIGPRMCLGQNFALAEMKILIALVVSKFSFSLSPEYWHSPVLRMLMEPEHRMNLLIKKV